MDYKKVEKFRTSILNWYATKGRHFPWRDTSDPYKILVAEYLLQKTDVEKVKVIYEKFIRKWPTIKSLSKAKISSILIIIKPLGLRYKALRLKSTAEVIEKKFNGRIPETEKDLIELPGIGMYISSAVQCFAFDKPKAILDTNVIRIFNRVFGIKSDKKRPRDDQFYWNFAQALVPTKHSKDYNWGLLDYGAIVCKSKNPLCGECILYKLCNHYKRIDFEK